VPNEFYFSYEFYGESDEVKKCFFQLIEPYVRDKITRGANKDFTVLDF